MKAIIIVLFVIFLLFAGFVFYLNSIGNLIKDESQTIKGKLSKTLQSLFLEANQQAKPYCEPNSPNYEKTKCIKLLISDENTRKKCLLAQAEEDNYFKKLEGSSSIMLGWEALTEPKPENQRPEDRGKPTANCDITKSVEYNSASCGILRLAIVTSECMLSTVSKE